MVGEHSSVWMNAVLRGDVHQIRVGHYSNIQDNSVLHGMKEQYRGLRGGLCDGGPQRDPAWVHHRSTLSDRHGQHHSEWRGHRVRIHHRGRNADPREDDRGAEFAVDGLTWKIPPIPG